MFFKPWVALRISFLTGSLKTRTQVCELADGFIQTLRLVSHYSSDRNRGSEEEDDKQVNDATFKIFK